MNKHRILNWALAGVAALTLSTSYMLDAAEPRQAEWTQTDELNLIQRAQEVEARIERAAQQHCIKTNGLNSVHRWTEDQQLVCTDKRGRVAITLRGGA